MGEIVAYILAMIFLIEVLLNILDGWAQNGNAQSTRFNIHVGNLICFSLLF